MTGDSNVDPSSASSPTGEARREHTGAILGIAVGLVVFPALVLGLLLIRGGSLDAAERLEELVEGELPFGLRPLEALRLISGELVLRLDREAAEGDGNVPATPNEVYLVEFRELAGVERMFAQQTKTRGFDDRAFKASGKMLAWEKDPKFEWHTVMERDEIAWRAWRADTIVERLFAEGGAWRDSVRVDLAQPGRFLVLIALWPEETPFDRDQLEILLRSVRMHETP